MKFLTKAIHAGQEPDHETGSVTPPIYMTSTFAQTAPGVHKGYEYTRADNPNYTRLEAQLAALENGRFCTVFSSGLGALTAMLSTLKSGNTVIALDGLYGGTYRLFTQVFAKFGVKFEIIALREMHRLKQALASGAQWLYCETPTNPLLDIIEIESVANLAKENGVRTMVDNTFASPYFQNPLTLGADAVLHSTTKYLAGHSDIIGGAIITNDPQFKEQLDFARRAMGLNPSPFDVWLTSRGVKTLALRMEQHQENATFLVDHLQDNPMIKKIYFPGLQNHPGHQIAVNQMRGYGGIVSVEFNLGLEETKQLISSFEIFTLAESLGGVESLVCQPATMTHASIPSSERAKMGLSDGLVRFSVGIEDPQDLIDDVEKAMNKTKPYYSLSSFR